MAHGDAERAEAIIRLAANRYNYKKTAAETGVSEKTLRRWDKIAPKKGVGELLERALERCLMRADDVGAGDLPIFIGILMDKWLLMQGEPTSRTETIAREVASLEPAERDELIAEAKAIIDRAKGRAVGA